MKISGSITFREEVIFFRGEYDAKWNLFDEVEAFYKGVEIYNLLPGEVDKMIDAEARAIYEADYMGVGAQLYD